MVLPTGIVKSKGGGGGGDSRQSICAKLGVLPTGIVKSKGGEDTKDMCKAKGCYQREL